MFQRILFVIIGVSIGIGIGYFIAVYIPLPQNKPSLPKKQVIGFLPYWLLDKASTDYSKYITTLTYFGLAINNDGTILKFANPQQLQPGWNDLASGKVEPFLQSAQTHGVTLSLLLDTGDIPTINTLISDPIVHARNLVTDVKPLLKQYDFSDLNLDIEYTQPSSDMARLHFTQFVQEVKKDLGSTATLTIEMSPLDAVKKQLIDIKSVGQIADHLVIMAYDYHSPDSYVTGPVAPLSGAGTISEYDVATAVEKTMQLVPSEKIILGIPLYGYEWETLGTVPRSAVIPGTGVLASNQRVEQLLDSCTSCIVTRDTDAEESFVIYKDQDTNTYNQIFYPDQQTTLAKSTFADKEQLGGMALWALGYEGKTVLDPLQQYKN